MTRDVDEGCSDSSNLAMEKSRRLYECRMFRVVSNVDEDNDDDDVDITMKRSPAESSSGVPLSDTTSGCNFDTKLSDDNGDNLDLTSGSASAVSEVAAACAVALSNNNSRTDILCLYDVLHSRAILATVTPHVV